MKDFSAIQNKIDQMFDRINEYLDRLTVRERIMVIVAGIVIIVASIGSALWYMHLAAENQNKRLVELKETMVWMQSNVESMKPADDLALSTTDKVQRVAQQQGLSVATQQQGERAFQLTAQHENYAVLANFLTQIAQMGVSVDQLDMQKQESQIKLTAVIH
ncbi:type II secretion system protein GspM [Acinetobacter rudis]|uniref:Type II secretion system protein GspM n=1 Tax=Acinetobacter rudis TaxID=632955 RepID=A0AAW8J6H0_9GAMM|nr:type II secretion system protein GspM [Acinetobacter rudis]MDQ8934713.1 type II secretion system protein GspM [Acinetobacter rudis]MDQ8951377.1 type II secretion system protein GspM [Acinetobacter rudis]MDQ9017206.1 type II secretion system protein GspM [Acinetobacter rudis]